MLYRVRTHNEWLAFLPISCWSNSIEEDCFCYPRYSWICNNPSRIYFQHLHNLINYDKRWFLKPEITLFKVLQSNLQVNDAKRWPPYWTVRVTTEKFSSFFGLFCVWITRKEAWVPFLDNRPLLSLLNTNFQKRPFTNVSLQRNWREEHSISW